MPGGQVGLMLTSDVADQGVSMDQRRIAVVEFLSNELDDLAHLYKEWSRDVDASPARLGQPPLWPSMWSSINRSLSQLIATFKEQNIRKPVKNAR